MDPAAVRRHRKIKLHWLHWKRSASSVWIMSISLEINRRSPYWAMGKPIKWFPHPCKKKMYFWLPAELRRGHSLKLIYFCHSIVMNILDKIYIVRKPRKLLKIRHLVSSWILRCFRFTWRHRTNLTIAHTKFYFCSAPSCAFLRVKFFIFFFFLFAMSIKCWNFVTRRSEIATEMFTTNLSLIVFKNTVKKIVFIMFS